MTSSPPLERSRLLAFLHHVRTKACLFPIACFLRAMSCFFYLGSLVRKYYLKGLSRFSPTPSIPVISVGSITVGGAGKTPVIQYLMNTCAHVRVGYVSRGYGRPTREAVFCYGDSLLHSSSVGDEAFLLAKRDPSLFLGIGSSKRKMTKLLLQKPLDVLFIDDGLQRYDIPFHLEVGVLPEKLLFTREYLFPFGLLREPMSRLKKVDLLFVIKENPFTPLSLLVEELERRSFDRYVVAEQQCSGWIDVQGEATASPVKRIALFSAIARPERVVILLKSMGYEIVDTFFLGDHEALLSKKFSGWANYWNRKGVAVVGTEKDWARHVRWPQDLQFCSFLRVDLVILVGEERIPNMCHIMGVKTKEIV